MLRFVHVNASYQGQAADTLNAGGVLKDISFHITKGESAALIGANGAGKTSLFLAAAGILPLSGGSVFIDGIELSKNTLKAARAKLGLVFQNPDDQLFMSRIYDDIMFGLVNMGVTGKEAKNRSAAVLGKLGIEHLADRPPFRLSGGEKKLCALAAVLVMEPELLLFDEPTAFLDPRSRRTVISVIRSLPHTKLIATHDLTFAEELCERALIMQSGSLAADGSPVELFAEEADMERWGL